MTHRRRGVLAALFVAAAFAATPLIATPAHAALAPGERVLPNGLTILARRATASGVVALEVWVRCPSDGWDAKEPGIARLTALATLAAKNGGASLRDEVRARGGQLTASVFQTATEFSIVAPAAAAEPLTDALVRHVFASRLDAVAFADARASLAAEQAAVAQSAVQALRDAAFGALFAAGPLHDSTFGDARWLASATLEDARRFAAASYAPGSAIVVSIGNADEIRLADRLAADGARIPAAQSSAMPASVAVASAAGRKTATISAPDVDVPGVALAWLGPPIADQRAATAMDFLSDYLADRQAGTLARAATNTLADARFAGQFVTLGQGGVFFVTATGLGLEPSAMASALRAALAPALARPIPAAEFAAARGAYETRLLRQMDSAQGLAENYGWYFVEGAPAYAPSATDAALGGAYFANASSLDPGYVREIARRYLGVDPIAVLLTPARSAASAAGGS